VALALGAGLAAVAMPAFPAADGSALELPAGVDVAIVVFEDLQCPDCRRAHPDLVAAATSTSVPLIVYDYPIPRHDWAFPAAVLARYFAQQSPPLGVEFRGYIFQNQPGVGVDNLREFGERFAAIHGQTLPGDVDPDGRLAALVQADFDLGTKIRLEYVPLMFVLSRGGAGVRSVEVKDARDVAAAVDRVRNGG
jgi:protein-disulfide isomerase